MATADSATGFIKRNRPPRVQISYADPIDANVQVELPFVMGVMSDLSGNASKVEKPRSPTANLPRCPRIHWMISWPRWLPVLR